MAEKQEEDKRASNPVYIQNEINSLDEEISAESNPAIKKALTRTLVGLEKKLIEVNRKIKEDDERRALEKMAELELKDAIKHGRPISKFVTDNLSEEVIEEYGEILDTLDYEEDKVHDKFTRIIIDGKQYLKNKSNVLFDISTKEKVGIYNERKIELFDTTRLMQLCVANLKCKL